MTEVRVFGDIDSLRRPRTPQKSGQQVGSPSQGTPPAISVVIKGNPAFRGDAYTVFWHPAKPEPAMRHLQEA